MLTSALRAAVYLPFATIHETYTTEVTHEIPGRTQSRMIQLQLTVLTVFPETLGKSSSTISDAP